jgi:large repetitive protein
VYADFRRIKGPRVYMVGPRVIETGKTYNYEVRLSLPYNNMEGEVEGYFTLPSGEKVTGEELEYSPTEDDLALGSIELHYTAWIKGYKDQGTEESQDIRARVWEYVWPDFNLYMRSDSDMAPAEVSASIRTIGLRGQLDDPKYSWELPGSDSFTVTDNRWDDKRNFQITAPGTYPVKITITDARGNISVVESTLDIEEAPPYEVGINYSASNDYSREPLELNMRPLLSGGHPRDRVEERIYKVDGEEIESNGYSARTVLDKGEHEVSLIVRTRMGEEVSKTLQMNVVENQPPVCSIRIDDRYSSWAFYAECEDVDGSMNAFEWYIDGNIVSVRSNRLTMSKYTYDHKMPVVELIGYDDGDAASKKVTAQ